jgi:hypothetical protein
MYASALIKTPGGDGSITDTGEYDYMTLELGFLPMSIKDSRPAQANLELSVVSGKRINGRF